MRLPKHWVASLVVVVAIGNVSRSQAQPEPAAPSTERDGMAVFLVAPLHGDAETLASQYAVTARLVTDLTQSTKPASSGERLGEYLLVFGGFVPKLVLEHEFGHARSCIQDGGHPRVRLTSWWQGDCEDLSSATGEGESQLRFAAAGVNQCMVDADLQYAVWARNGSVGYPEALDYLLSQTNLALYAGRSQVAGGSTGSKDDLAAYTEWMRGQGRSMSVGRLLLVAALADLASGPVWAALRGQAQFLKTGDRTVSMPRLRLGDTTATYPNLQVFLTSNGLVIGGSTFIGDDPRRAVQASVYRSDGDATWALGVRLPGLPVGEHITLSPYVRATLGERSGRAAGVDVREATQRRVLLMGRVEYVDGDLLTEPLGKRHNWAAYVGLVVQLP